MHKKVYDENSGVYIHVDNWTGEGISSRAGGFFDTLFSSVGKKVLETVGKTAIESGAKKVGTEVGNLAADKITGVFKKKKQPPPVGDKIVKELRKKDTEDINLQINELLSGSGRRDINLQINELLSGRRLFKKDI
jgi:hypothetical protein